MLVQAFKGYWAAPVDGRVPANLVVVKLNALKVVRGNVVARSQRVAVKALLLERSNETLGNRIDDPNNELCGSCFESVNCGWRTFCAIRIKCLM